MAGSRVGERGQVAVYAVLLFPTLLLVLVFVFAVGSVEMLRSRLHAQLDMAALTATQAIDLGALAAGGHPALVPDKAEVLARQSLLANGGWLGGRLLVRPEAVAGGAQVAVTNRAGADPITGLPVTAPTVSIRVVVPVAVPVLAIAGLRTRVDLELTGSAAARS